jgi:hypothetical protein
MPESTRFRFDGQIAGAGAESGTRLVLGHWTRSPHGGFADVMVQRPDGHRVLLAPDPWVAEFVSSTYTFDEVVQVPVDVRIHDDAGRPRWTVSAGPLAWSFTVGRRTALGHLLRAVPPPLGRTHTFARVTDVIAPRVFPGVRTLGTAGNARAEWYAARDLHRVTDSVTSWSGTDLGAMTDVDPPPDFGFSSTPRTPALTALTTIVQVPTSQAARFATDGRAGS